MGDMNLCSFLKKRTKKLLSHAAVPSAVPTRRKQDESRFASFSLEKEGFSWACLDRDGG
jgi:hypothetical protein